jgi:hypothetical protein
METLGGADKKSFFIIGGGYLLTSDFHIKVLFLNIPTPGLSLSHLLTHIPEDRWLL